MNRVGAVAAALLSLSFSAFAQSATVTTLERLPAAHGSISSLTRGADGRQYGLFLGARSAIFVLGDMAADPIPITVLHEFNQAEYAVDGLALGADGHLYGVIQRGGANFRGALFRLEGDGTVTMVHSFSATDLGAYGLVQAGVTVGADGAFYGVAGSGAGAFERGAIFRVDAAGAFSIVKSFAGGSEGTDPRVRMTLGPDGQLYGTTYAGFSSSDNGVVFRFNPVSGTLTTLKSFTGAAADTGPGSPLVLASDGKLYGTTVPRTSSNVPTEIYRVGPSIPYQTVHTLTVEEADYPAGALIEGTDGYLYGVSTDFRIDSHRTAFRVSFAGDFEVLHSFTSTEVIPRSFLAQQPDGRWLGAGTGGVNSSALFRLSTDFTYSLALRAVPSDLPAGPTAVVEYEGGLVGATRNGGVYGYGAIFRLDASGAMSTLHSFADADGSAPFYPIAALGGNIYGTTVLGGAFGCGTLFRRSAAGVVSTLHHFACNEGMPGAVTASSDGNVYGVAIRYASGSVSRIFKVDASGTYTLVDTFATTQSLSGALVEGSDGRMYGTYSYGTGGFGGVFAVGASGIVPVYTFTGGANGSSPTNLVRGPGDTLYGTTLSPNRVFRITLNGTFTPVYDFTGTFYPRQAAGGLDGDFYGAGQENFGPVLVKVSSAGAFEKVHTFGGSDVGVSLTAASDGRRFGTNFYGPPTESGNVYSITPATPIATAVLAAAASGAFGGTTTLTATLSAPGGPIANQVVAFTLNGAPVGNAMTNAAGVATVPNVALTGIAPGVDGDAIGASFAGAAFLAPSVAALAPLTVIAASTTSLIASPLTVDVLQPATLTATVTGTPGLPTGNVEFRSDTTVLGTVALSGSTATLIVNGLASGAHAVTATYVGDTGFAASSSAAVTVTVRSAAVSTFTIAATGGLAAAGTRPTIAAAVVPLGGGTATGSVQFLDASTGLIGTAPLVNGVATIQPAGLTVGLHIIVARYAGNGTLSPSSSSPILLTVYSGAAPIATSLAVTATPIPALLGQPVTFTATVTPASGTPTGLVVFLSDGALVGTATLSSVGGVHSASITTSALSRGSHVVSVLYIAGAGFASSSSLPAVQVVQ